VGPWPLARRTKAPLRRAIGLPYCLVVVEGSAPEDRLKSAPRDVRAPVICVVDDDASMLRAL